MIYVALLKNRNFIPDFNVKHSLNQCYHFVFIFGKLWENTVVFGNIAQINYTFELDQVFFSQWYN